MATRKPKPIPEGYHTVTPYLVVNDAAAAIDFYKRAFGATEVMRMPRPDGKIGHAELKVGDSMIMLTDETPQAGMRSPHTLGGSPVGIFLYVKDVDAMFSQALAAGARSDMPVTDMFWGDRYGKLTDTFGHQWHLATHKEDVAPQEMQKRAAESMATMGQHAHHTEGAQGAS